MTAVPLKKSFKSAECELPPFSYQYPFAEAICIFPSFLHKKSRINVKPSPPGISPFLVVLLSLTAHSIALLLETLRPEYSRTFLRIVLPISTIVKSNRPFCGKYCPHEKTNSQLPCIFALLNISRILSLIFFLYL